MSSHLMLTVKCSVKNVWPQNGRDLGILGAWHIGGTQKIFIECMK